MKVLFLLAFLAVAGYAYADLTVECPDDLDPDRLLVSHPCSCTTYFVCGTVPPTAMPCPNGLQFSQELQRCDYSWIVKCKPKPECPKNFYESLGVQ